MTDMERRTFCAALSRGGAQAQLTMAFEELAELQDVANENVKVLG